MLEKEKVKILKDYLIEQIRKLAKEEKLDKLAAVLRVLNTPDEQIPHVKIEIAKGYSELPSKASYLIKTTQANGEVEECEITKKVGFCAKHKMRDKLLINNIANIKVRNGRRAKGSAETIG